MKEEDTNINNENNDENNINNDKQFFRYLDIFYILFKKI